MKFYHNSVSGLKVETAKRDNYGKKEKRTGNINYIIITLNWIRFIEKIKKTLT